MRLELQYGDRYTLWADLVRGNTDRLLITTGEPVELNSQLPIEVRVGETGVRMMVRAQVVGRRRQSRRFPAGVYVHISETELDKCRRFLGLQPHDTHSRVRRSSRVQIDAPARVVDPSIDAPYTVRNVSQHGVLLAGPAHFEPGQGVTVDLHLDGLREAALTVEAEVAWIARDRNAAGLRFLELSVQTRAALKDRIDRARAKMREPHRDRMPILVVDDDPEIVYLIERTLSRHGYEVFHSVNGGEALTMVRELHPRLVLLDILLPGIDGADICRHMRADPELAEIPVIFISSLDEPRLHTVADESGATDYMAKPLHLSDLIDMVGYYLTS
jgi:CheY-like chemotaxis protein